MYTTHTHIHSAQREPQSLPFNLWIISVVSGEEKKLPAAHAFCCLFFFPFLQALPFLPVTSWPYLFTSRHAIKQTTCVLFGIMEVFADGLLLGKK